VPHRRAADVFVDVCTQRDYLNLDGACPAANARAVQKNIKHLMAFARWAKIPTISCVDARRPDAVRGIPHPHCVLGTPGQRKITFSVLPDHVTIESDNVLCISLEILQQHQQAILIKQHRDPFTNPKLARLRTDMPTQHFTVFGVALEASIRLLVLGLILRHRRATLIHDACGFWSLNEADMALRQLAAKGCEIRSTHEVIRERLAQLSARARSGVWRHPSVA
jgi:nicotinamidase-related amidase